MKKELREFLESLGLAGNATERQAWIYYHQLGADDLARAQQIRWPQRAEGTGDRGNGDGGNGDGEFSEGGTEGQAGTTPVGTATATRAAAGTPPNGPRFTEADFEERQQRERSRQATINRLGSEFDLPAERIAGAIEDGTPEDAFRAYALEWLRGRRGHGVGNDPGSIQESDEPDVLGRSLPQFAFRDFNAIVRRNPEGGQRAAGLAMALLMSHGSERFRTADPAERLLSVRQRGGRYVCRRLGELPTEARVHLERARDFAEDASSMALSEVVAECVRMDGFEIHGHGAQGVVDTLSARGFSSATLTNVMTTTFSAEFIGGYEGYPDTTQGFTSEGTLPNFQEAERTRNTKGSGLSRHKRGGVADHTTFGDQVEKYALKRYSGQFVIDEMDLIDDRFGAIEQVAPMEMGEEAAELRPDLVYAILLANANMEDGIALFNASHSNLNASSALSPANIKAGITAIATQSENGRNLRKPRGYMVIVPEALRWNADQYINSPIISNDSGSGNRNSIAAAQESIQWVADARLDNGVTDPRDDTAYSGSATTWFMAVTNSRHVIEVGYLRGSNRMPMIRPYTLTEGAWGIGWDIKHDIGAKALDWLGLQKFTA